MMDFNKGIIMAILIMVFMYFCGAMLINAMAAMEYWHSTGTEAYHMLSDFFTIALGIFLTCYMIYRIEEKW